MQHTITNIAQAARVAEFIRTLNVESQGWEVTIEKMRDKRTDRQRRLYWKWIGIIGSEIGYDKDDLHDALREKFLPLIEVDILGKRVKRLTSTGKLSIAKMAQYMCDVDRFAAYELSILLPHPEDVDYEKWAREYE